MSPVASAIGMNSSGGTSPRPGSSQRSSASKPTTVPAGSSALGWYTTSSAPSSMAARSSPNRASRRRLYWSRSAAYTSMPEWAALAWYMATSARCSSRAGEGLQRPEVLPAEAAAVAGAVGDQQRPDRPGGVAQRHHQRLADAVVQQRLPQPGVVDLVGAQHHPVVGQAA